MMGIRQKRKISVNISTGRQAMGVGGRAMNILIQTNTIMVMTSDGFAESLLPMASHKSMQDPSSR